MQTNEKVILRLYIFIAGGLILATVATVLNSFLYLFHFDRTRLLFEVTAYTQAYHMLSGAFVLFCFFLLFAYGRSKLVTEHVTENLLINALCTIGFVAIFCTTILFIFTTNQPLGRHGGTIGHISLAFTIPSAMYFFYHMYSENRKLKSLFGFALIIWCILVLFSINSYISIPLNSPLRIGSIFSFTAILLFFAFDMRLHIYRQVNGMLFASGLAVLFFSLSNALPQLLLSSAGRLDISLPFFYNLTELAIVVYAMSRMFAAINLLKSAAPIDEDEYHESDEELKEWAKALSTKTSAEKTNGNISFPVSFDNKEASRPVVTRQRPYDDASPIIAKRENMQENISPIESKPLAQNSEVEDALAFLLQQNQINTDE